MGRKYILRVSEAIKRELGFVLDRKLADPRIGMVTVTRVDLSVDLRHAKVFVGLLGSEDEKASAMEHLRGAARYIRSELAERLDVRRVPELAFVLDDSSESYLRIVEVLKRIHEEDGERRGEGPDEDPEGS